jgi:glycosyltransferase involved in cell wall biosynthesis
MDKMSSVKDLKVVQVSPTYFKDLIGGGERYPWELAKALSKYVNVTLIVFGKDRRTEKMSETLTVEGYPAITFPPPLFTKTNPFPLTLSFLKEINKAHIVHIHQFNTLISCLVIFYARFKNKIICVTDHGGGYFKLSKLFPMIGRYVDLYMLVSHFSYKKFAWYKNDYQVIYGGVDPSKFHPLNIKKENKVLFVGKILRVKGIDNLIKAVQGLDIELHVDAKLLDKKYLKLLMNLDRGSKAIFNFNVTDKELINEYNSAVVTVLPSIIEIFPLVVLESMACGTPVICTDAGGMPEIVEDGENGFIVPLNDPKRLEEKIRYFLENPDESKRMGENARKRILEDFTWDAVARRCIEGYSELLNEERKNG